VIRRLRLENFKSHGSTELRLEPLSLLVGPTGAGKSNLLRALWFLQSTVSRTLGDLFPPASPFEFRLVRSRWAEETGPIGFEIEASDIDGHDVIYTLKFAEAPPPQGVYVLKESLQRRKNDGSDWQWVFQRDGLSKEHVGEFGTFLPSEPTVLHWAWNHREKNETRPSLVFAREVARALWKFGYFHLEVSWLKEPSDGRETKRIGYSGQGLPSFLATLMRDDQPRFDAIVAAMRELLPTLDSIIVNRAGMDREGLAMLFRGFRGYVNAPDLSDGTLLTLGLLAVMHGTKNLRTLCIEEPETGLHPRRLRWLFDRFIDLAYPKDDRSPIQVLLTTHSPYLVDFFKDMQSAITVVEHKDGRTSMTNLVDIKQKLHDESATSSIGHEWATGLFEGL
jgi:predicted ATPase